MTDSTLRIAVARPLPPPLLDRLRPYGELVLPPGEASLDAAGIADLLSLADYALVSGLDRVDAAAIAVAPRLRAIANIGVGFDNIDVAAFTQRGVLVSNTPGVVDDATADLAFGLLLAAARRIVEADAYVRAGRWDAAPPPLFGTDVHHARLGIIGMGGVGRAVARRASGFDMEVVYHNRHRLDAATETAGGASYLALDELLRSSDFVLVQVPYTPQTHHMIGAPQLALMKKTAILVNTARGGVVDDAALIAALHAGQVAGAALDVFENEPRLNAAFRDLPNVILTPHIGSATFPTRYRMAELAVLNLIDAISGNVPRNCINPGAR